MKISKYFKLSFTSLLITTFLMAGFTACSHESDSNTTPEPEVITYPEITIPESDAEDFVPTLSSVEFAANLAIGWNLGNTLDAYSSKNIGLASETCWGMPETKEDMITAVKAAGFKTIRIPVSWHNHISNTSNFKIDSAWMARVKQIVDWAYNQDMYVIINIHHDNLTTSEINTQAGFALSKDSSIQNKSKAYIKNIWTQIAIEFAGYDEKLIFEILNEPRDVDGLVFGDEWNYSGKDACDIITSYEQAGLDAIRAVPGNRNRFVMVPGYAASGSNAAMLKNFTFPTDTATDKLILSGHAYSPYIFAMGDAEHTTFTDSYDGELSSIFTFLKTNYTDKGIGVVMGEASATDKKNTAERIKWVNSYYSKAKAAKIPVVLWDNMNNTGNDIAEHHGYFNRNSKTWYYPSIIEAMMKVVYGDNFSGTIQ